MTAWINRIGTAVPAHDIHAAFVQFAEVTLPDVKSRSVFARMAARAGIAHRFSHLRPGDIAAGEVDADGFYTPGAFPGTAARMRAYETHALNLALQAIAGLGELGAITHLIAVSCTGFTAPGLDLQIAARLALPANLSRTLIGFMGCAAAVPALRAADAIVRSDPQARVLVVNVELCSLHLRETTDIETALTFLLFGDGASAALVTAEPTGLALGEFRSAVIPDTAGLITWAIGDHGFEMYLSGRVPAVIADALRRDPPGTFDLWAVHAGGRTVLDAVEIGLHLPPTCLAPSRAVLNRCGNMSSATLMFVLADMLASDAHGQGLVMAFGPGMACETFHFARAVPA
jgi:predicted naringenin-chalcone synthase